MIELKNITKKYKDASPINDVSVVIHDGDVISVIGPSGCGKSTLLRCIDLLEMPTSGEIWIDGEKINTKSKDDITKLHRKVGMLFQSINLFNNLTAIENVMVPQIEVLGRSRQDAYEKALHLLDEVGLREKCFQYPDSLSGGQKQRVAIARTLAMDTDVILLDEPTSALDPSMVSEVLIVIKKLAQMGKTMLIVTHEMDFARKVGNRVFYMDECGIYEDGTPEQIFTHPMRDKTRQFVQKSKVLRFAIKSKGFDFPQAVSQLYEFGFKYGITRQKCNVMISVFEELCMNIIAEQLCNEGKEIDIETEIEYMENNDTIHMDVRYKGNFDPRNTENRLALQILESNVNSIEYSLQTNPSGDCTDRVKIIVNCPDSKNK